MKISLEGVDFVGDDGHRLQKELPEVVTAELKVDYSMPPNLAAAVITVFAPEPKESED